MRTLLANLQADISTSLSDLAKTVRAGRVTQKIVDSLQVLSPPLTSWADVFIAYGIGPSNCDVNPATGRKFELQNTNAANPTVLAFDFDLQTGLWTYIGKVIVTIPAGTHSSRGFSFDDSDPNNIKLYFNNTVTTALCQGGTYYTWKVTLADFTPSGTTIFLANDDDQKGTYFAQNPAELGRAHLGITGGGVTSGLDFEVVANKPKFFAMNGTSLAMQIYAWDSSLGTPAIDGKVVNGIDAQTTPFAGTAPNAYFSMGASQNGYSTLANTTAAFEAVILKNGTNPIPANFVQTLTTQTQYYMRDLQLVGGVWYFNLSTTATGAAVVPSTTTSAFTLMRANGITSNQFLFRTANITPTLAGTLLTANSFGATVPTSAPAAPALNGEDCLALATGVTLYLGKVSDLAHLSPTWTSLSGVNLLGTAVDIVTPAATTARHSKTLDRWIYVTNVMKFVIKPHSNNLIDRVFGSLITNFYEAQNPAAVPAGLSALTSISIADGWLFITSGTTNGQRGVISCDVRSDSLFDYSYIVSPVLKVPPGSILHYISTIEALFDYTDPMNFFIKHSTNPTDPIFSTNTGWIPVPTAEDNEPMALGPYFRIKVSYNNATFGLNTPSQLNDLVITYQPPAEISDKWAGDVDNTSRDGETPTKSAFEILETYVGAVPEMIYRAYDLAGNLVVTASTVADAADFEYSSDGGTVWNPLGTIPNVVGTRLRYNHSSPPGVVVASSLREA